jgi:hypothetical protein
MGQNVNLFGAQPSVNGSFRRNMGLGALGLSTTSIKRKFRWTLTISPKCPNFRGFSTGIGQGYIGPNFCKVASRPNYDIEETELNFLNAKTWIAGKLTWQSITATFIDASANEISNLYLWLGQNARLDDNIKFWQGTSFQDYAASAELILYTGCGQPMEAWLLDNVWPQATNFGELDYTSSEEATIELTLRYDSVKYFAFCPNIVFSSCCSPCNPAMSGVAAAVGA